MRPKTYLSVEDAIKLTGLTKTEMALLGIEGLFPQRQLLVAYPYAEFRRARDEHGKEWEWKLGEIVRKYEMLEQDSRSLPNRTS